MIQLSKERILEWQKILKEDYGREVLFAEAAEAANNLIGFFDLLLKIDRRNKKAKHGHKENNQ